MYILFGIFNRSEIRRNVHQDKMLSGGLLCFFRSLVESKINVWILKMEEIKIIYHIDDKTPPFLLKIPIDREIEENGVKP